MKSSCVTMLLAGGQGSRLSVLTEEIAKPAVPIGGKYRIIDFVLSNCANSNMDIVGVLTQYQPHLLSAHIGSGRAWGLDRMHGGVFILPPYMNNGGLTWYTGTANAVYQNLNFIRRFNPEYVLILSGDHVYKMNYMPMLEQHERTGAAVTIAVHEVPVHEASRFGIVECDKDWRITRFVEKPKIPSSNMASMGIYVFNRSILEQILVTDHLNPISNNDFGKDIIPALLNDRNPLYAYNYDGYWKDVGTFASLWETNMDILSPDSGLDLYEPYMKIYSPETGLAPGYVAGCARVTASLVAEGAKIYGNVNNSVISQNAYIGKNADVQHSFVMPDAIIEEGATIKYSIIAQGSRIGKYAVVGGLPHYNSENFITVIGKGRIVGDGCLVPPSFVLEKDILPTSGGQFAVSS